MNDYMNPYNCFKTFPFDITSPSTGTDFNW